MKTQSVIRVQQKLGQKARKAFFKMCQGEAAQAGMVELWVGVQNL